MTRNWIQDVPDTEAFWIDRVLFDVQHKPDHKTRFYADPETYMAGMPLSPASRRALGTTDIGALYLAGANPYLLRAHCLGLRIPEDKYLGALRAAGEEHDRG
jgi:protocatechuate 4,5-dioxygenase alpha chain